jgi:hypothetical protein
MYVVLLVPTGLSADPRTQSLHVGFTVRTRGSARVTLRVYCLVQFYLERVTHHTNLFQCQQSLAFLGVAAFADLVGPWLLSAATSRYVRC